MAKLTLIVAFLAVTFNVPIAFGQTVRQMQTQLDNFTQFIRSLDTQDGLTQQAREHHLQAAYEKQFGAVFRDTDFSSMPKQDLHLLFEAASLASFENPDGRSYRDALQALHSLGPDATDREVRLAQGMLFQARRFQELEAFDIAYANRNLAKIQVDASAQPATHEVLTPSDGRLTARIIDIDYGPRLVVVAHPSCHFTRNAMQAIRASPELNAVMHKHSIWISPPDHNMDFTAFSAWRHTYPEEPISIAYSYSSWPELDEWGTPTFYFFNNGKLMETLVGWPKGGRMSELLRGLAKIGLTVNTGHGPP